MKQPKTPHEIMNAVIMFGLNYPHDFIENAFPAMHEHLKRKFSSIYERHGSRAAMVMFWTELDISNQICLSDYIIQYYTNN